MMDEKSSSSKRLIINFHEMIQLAESRPAGSPGEEKLKQYLEEKLRISGYSVSRLRFKFPKIPRLYNEQFFNAAFVTVAVLLIHPVPLFGFMLPIIFSLLPVLMLETERLFPMKLDAENVVAVPENYSLEDVKVLIVAHLDTALTNPILRGTSGKFVNFCQNSFFNISFIIALQCLAVIMDIPIPTTIVIAINTFIIICAIVTVCYKIWASFIRQSIYSPGVNDNTTGVAAAVNLAEEYGRGNNSQMQSTAFLFTSAEEQGLFGARSFINSSVKWVRKPFVINLDSLAGGNKLGLVARYGRLLPEFTSQTFNRSVKAVDQNLVDIIHIHRCGDYLPFIWSGYQVISLETVWNGGTPPEYHTIEDTPDRINVELLSKAYWVIVESINKLSLLSRGD